MKSFDKVLSPRSTMTKVGKIGFGWHQGSQSMCEFSAFRYFFKTNVAQSVAELIVNSKKHEMWSFSIKFGELRYKNVNNTFMIKWDSAKKHSQ